MPTRLSFFRLAPLFALAAAIFLTVSAPSFAQTKTEATKEPPAEESLDTFRLEHLKFLKMSPAAEQTIMQQNVGAAMAAAIQSVPHEADKEQAPNVQSQAAASKAMGFPVAMVSARKDPPVFQLNKKEAAELTIDRASLQEMLDQAKRPDLLLPASFEQAHMHLKIPQSLIEMYGHCVGAKSNIGDAANADTPKADTANSEPDDDEVETPLVKKARDNFDDCLIFFQMAVPEARISSSMRFPLVMQILAELVGDTDQQTVDSTSADWSNTFPVPVPSSLVTMETVQASGGDATLLRLKDRGNAVMPYVLVWIRDGKIYALLGPGEPANARELVDSVQ